MSREASRIIQQRPALASGSGRLTYCGGAALNWLLLVLSLLTSLVAVEVALRVYHGKLFALSSQLRSPPDRSASPRAQYHPTLGWVPRSGSFAHSAGEQWNVDDAGMRTNGTDSMASRAPVVVAVGDSFTFGDEVPDHYTWPAQLERRIGRPVLNAGVFAYGIDQAYLRANELFDKYKPEWLVLAFISDDINRNEFSYYSGSKPYFSYGIAGLTLNNVPVPIGHIPEPPYAPLREALSYSLLCSAIVSRALPRWWMFGAIDKVHDDGERVTIELLEKLDTKISAAGGRFLAVALATNGRVGNNRRISAVISEASRRGITILDLVPEVEAIAHEGRQGMFMQRGHYAPDLNGLVADRIAAQMQGAR